MSFANLLGQMLQQGMGDTTGARMQAGAASVQGAGLDSVFGALLGGGGGTAQGMDLGALARQFLTQPQAGGMTGGQMGGLGALAGALLGGGGGAAKGAVGGGALALLGTLAVNALQTYAASQGTGAAALMPAEAAAMTSEDTARLVLRAMISAAKADGRIDGQEMARIMGEADKDGITDAERQFLLEEMARPVDIAALAAAVPSPVVGAEVYAASLLAVTVDTEAERAYLRDLAAALRLDGATVARLHQALDAPAA